MQNSTQFQVYNASAGSGKTFMLVKEYLKILLSTNSVFRFQNILAITFTNKAAAEMKERVLENLQEFSEGKTNDMFVKIKEEIAVSDAVLQQRSKRVLDSILQDYSAFNITTIDAFTHRIIRNFSFDLGLSLNFEVEMNSDLLLEEAVDLLISKIGFDKELTRVLIAYSLDKADDDKSWDITKDLKEFAKILINEDDRKQLKKLENKTVQEFSELKSRLKKNNQSIEKQSAEIGKKALQIIAKNNLSEGIYRGSYFSNHFDNLIESYSKCKFFDQSRLKYNVENNKIYNNKAEDFSAVLEKVEPILSDLYFQSEALHQQYALNNLVLKSLIPLAVLRHINHSLNEIKEQNNIRLNSEFNQLISDKIKDEPAPFIYERIGEKFQYYFIDEMQDTSELQWQNLIPLIENALISETLEGNRGNLMLVGDAKQAIYRWRGGKAEQFIDLTSEENPFSVKKEPKNLKTNFRSFSEIIDFNNQFFTQVSAFLNNEAYRKLYVDGNQQEKTNKKGGFVQISFVEKDKDDEEKELLFPKKVLEVIQNLDAAFSLSDVCVLVRKKKEGIALATYLSENKIPIISSETLLLKNNEMVSFIINLLSFLDNNEDKKAFVSALYYLGEKAIHKEEMHFFIENLMQKSNTAIFEALQTYGFFFNEKEFLSLPFYDAIEYIIRSFKLTDTTDAFLFSFLDFVLEYQQKKGDGLNDFLAYWEQKKEKACITTPAGQNAVQIMTIHKSKGLEFPVVIYSYDLDIYREIKPKIWYENLDSNTFSNFDTTLITYSKTLNHFGEYGENLYSQRREEIQLDNLNLLYVALTRAVEQLYIISEKRKTPKELLSATFYSDFFVDFLTSKKEWTDTKYTYDFGNPKRVAVKERLELKYEFETQETFISSPWESHTVSIVANASKLWDTEQGKTIEYGNLMHEILSKIITVNDVEDVIQQYVFEGVLTETEATEVYKKINEVVKHPLLEKYFKIGLQVFNEQALISTEKTRQIPDRLVIINNKVAIIDYKTGVPNEKHQHQINSYENTLNEIGYTTLEKVLIYIDSKVVVEITNQTT